MRLCFAISLLLLCAVWAHCDEKKDQEQIEIYKAKTKAMLALKQKVSQSSAPLGKDVQKALAEGKAQHKAVYVWVAAYKKEVAEKLPGGIHVFTEEWHGNSDQQLAVKVMGSEYLFEQSKLNSKTVDIIRQLVELGLSPTSMAQPSKRPPIIDVTRSVLPSSEEPPLLDPFNTALQKVSKTKTTAANAIQMDFCGREPKCSCGCQSGGECRCSSIRSQSSSAPIPSYFNYQAPQYLPVQAFPVIRQSMGNFITSGSSGRSC